MDYNPYTLLGKTILVTGASSGIGRETSIEISKLGANVVLTARTEESLKETLSMLTGTTHQTITADLSSEDDIQNLVNLCPKIDGLVNNAGISTSKPIAFYTTNEIDKVFGANTFAPMLLIRSLLKKKKINEGASIVFTSSVASICSSIGNGIYGASKAALTAYMKYCARELAPKGIRATAVHPGMVETKLIHGGAISEENLSEDVKNYPLGRYGKPKEIALAITFLLSDASAWTTGVSLFVDGGYTLIK